MILELIAGVLIGKALGSPTIHNCGKEECCTTCHECGMSSGLPQDAGGCFCKNCH